MSFSGVDETRTCRDCKQTFIFTAGEQAWLAEKIADPNPPNRCKKCKAEYKARGQQSNIDGGRFNATGGYNSGSNHQPQPYVTPSMPVQAPKPTQAQPIVEHRTRSGNSRSDRYDRMERVQDNEGNHSGKRDRKQRRNRND